MRSAPNCRAAARVCKPMIGNRWTGGALDRWRCGRMLGPMLPASRVACCWLLLAAIGCGESPPPAAATSEPDPAKSVELVVHFGDGAKKSYRVAWAPKLTVLAAMQRAKESGELDFQHRHTGEMAFLDAIGSTKNETGPGARS